MGNNDKFKIKTFNPVFWILIFITVFCSYLFNRYTTIHGIESATKLFYIIHIFSVIFYFVYKYSLTIDKEYYDIIIKNGLKPSTFLTEFIPIQLCNVSYIIAPIAFYTKSPILIIYCEVVTLFCVILAILMPYCGLSNDSIFKMRVLGYYGTHLYMLFMSLAIWGLKIVYPDYQYIKGLVLLLILLSFIAHITNVLLNELHIASSNYMFTYYHDNNPVLKYLYNFIHIKWIYTLPIPIIFGLFMYFFIFIFKLIIH